MASAISLFAFRAHREVTEVASAIVDGSSAAGAGAAILPFRRALRDALGPVVPSRDVASLTIRNVLAAAGERLSLPVARLARRWPGFILATAITAAAVVAVSRETPAHFGNDDDVLSPPMVVTVELVADTPAPEEVSAAPAVEEISVPPPPELTDLSAELAPPEAVEVPAPPELPPITPAQFAIPDVPEPVVKPVVQPRPEAKRTTIVRSTRPVKAASRPKPRGGVSRAASTARQAASSQAMRARRDYLGRVRSTIISRLSRSAPEGRVVVSFGITPGGQAVGVSAAGTASTRAAAMAAVRGGFGAVPAGVQLPGRFSVVINFE